MEPNAHPRARAAVEVVVAAAGVAFVTFAWRADFAWFQRHFAFSFMDPTTQAKLARLSRAIAAVVGLVLIVGARPLLGRWAGRRSLGQMAAGCARASLGLVVALIACELLVRREERLDQLHAQSGIFSKVGEGHSRYGWIAAPSRTSYTTFAGRPIAFAANARRERAATADALPDVARPTILLAGESIAVGHGISYEDTFGARVGARLGVQVVNLAMLGYGCDQAYLRLIDTLPEFARPVAVVTLFVPGQLERHFNRDRPRLELDPRGAPTLLLAPGGALDKLRLMHRLRAIPYFSEAAIERNLELTRVLFRDTAARARARGADVLFVVPSFGPERSLDEHPEAWILRELFETEGLPYLLVDLDPTWRVRDDGHPDERAHARIGEAIARTLHLTPGAAR